MISPELLKRYPFFGFMDESEIKAVAMIAEEVSYKEGETLLETDKPADALYFLVEGNVDQLYVVSDHQHTKTQKEFHLNEFNAGDIIGISALIEPYQYTATVRAHTPARAIKITSGALRALCEVDAKLAYGLMSQTAKAAMERLHSTRILLAAARA